MTVKQADELFTAALKIEYHAGTDAALYDWLPHQVRSAITIVLFPVQIPQRHRSCTRPIASASCTAPGWCVTFWYVHYPF